MSEPADDNNDTIFGNFGDEVNKDMHKNIARFAEILGKMNTPVLPPPIDLTIIDKSENLKEFERDTTVPNTRSKRKMNQDNVSMMVESSHSSSEKTVKNNKNKKRANKKAPAVLNSEPIEIKESDDEGGVNQDTGVEDIPLKEEHFNGDVSVKVVWKSVHNHRFKMRKYQKMKYIFDFFNKSEGIDVDKLFFVVNGKMIYPDDTPESLDLSVIDFIDGGEVRTAIEYHEPRSPKKLDNDSIEFKILVKNQKRPMFVRIKKTEQMIILMIKVAEQLDLPLKNLKFIFDGENLKTCDTAEILDMDGGECIEVQTDFQPCADDKFITTIVDADSINHLVVFLTGTQAFPPGTGGLVYFSWPDENAPPTWQLLGFVSNEKPSAIFKISNLKKGITDGAHLPFMFGAQKISHNAQIGISIELLECIHQQVALISQQVASSYLQFGQKMLENFLNYASSFACTASQLPLTRPDATYVPLSTLQSWYTTFERRLQNNPYFWRT